VLVLDGVRAVAVVVALVFAARQRFVLGIACSLASAYLLCGAVAGVAPAIARHGVGGEWAFTLFFLGPSAVPFSGASRFPLGSWIATHPLASLVGTTVLALVPFARASAQSRKLSPHSLASRRWDAIASSFLLLAVIAATRLVAGVLEEWILRQ
jgi:hypothetical protein